MEGKDTDLDKTILEAIKDPLTHIVRNAADHGIESPDVRVAAGKPEEGCLLLRAFHEGGHVIIEISDDGGGLKTERIKQKAIEKGIVTPAQIERMSEQDVNRLIFAAGFSTAEKVTNISGRGVGMDVVRSNIEKIGGAVDVSSVEGRGTTLKIKIPLTLAIVPALIVTSNEQRFAVPQVSLVELLRVEAENVERQIEEIRGALFYRLRGDLLPLVYLTNELGMVPVQLENLEDGPRAVNIVVVRADEREFGLVVDMVHDTEEIVVKPLGRQLKDIPVFAGATIMGDGKVALILDVMGLAKRASVVSEVSESSASQKKDETDAIDKQSLLLLKVNDSRLAVYLDMIDRLEEFRTDQIEVASGREVVQYRGGIMPLIDLGDFFGGAVQRMSDDLHVVVFSSEGSSIGLIVDRIDDIVEETISLGSTDGSAGILGSAIVQGKVTDFIDLSAVLEGYRNSYTKKSSSHANNGEVGL
jgi:two-component system chemotaxis sensor kinase CheA